MLKTLFFGTSAFAVPSLRVVAARTQLGGVVTQPDRPSGRGQRSTETPVKQTARDLNLPVYEPVELRTFSAKLREEPYDLFVLASYGKIIPQSLLALPRLGALNVHPSLLPRHRGATPIQTALALGESRTGVTIMLMDAGMDTGPIVLQAACAIEPEESYGALHDRLASAGARLLGDALDLAETSELRALPQTGEPSATKPLRKADLVIDWRRSARELVAQIRSLSPAPAARGPIAGETVKVVRARIGAAATAHPGTPLGVDGDALVLACGDGSVAVEEVVAPNRGRESGASFWRRTRSRESA